MSTPEEHVLAARDPSVIDENDWEEFGLTEVKIYAQGKSRFANLLAANEDNPVRVSGVLDELEADQEHILLDELYRSKRIHIDNVTHYAFGQHEDGEFGIWIAGRAGWFSINPSKQYKPIYHEVVEAIDLHYFLVDRYNSKGKSKGKKSLSVDDLFEEYIRHTHGRCADAEDASEVFYNHRVFLLTHMLEDTDKNGLRSSTIFQYLCEAYPDEFEELQARIKRRREVANGEPGSSDSEPKPNGSSVFHSADEQRQADVCFETLVNITESDLIPIRQLNIKTLARFLFERYKLGSIEYANDLIRARAPLLLQLMDSTHPGGLDFTKRVIYREFQAASEQESPKQPQVSPTPLRERSPPPPPPSHSDDDTPVVRKGHNRKSVLRPPRYSSKAAERLGNGKRRIIEPEDEASMSEQDSPTKMTRAQPRLSPLVSRPKQAPNIPLVRENSHPERSVLEPPNSIENRQSPDLTPNGPGDTWACTVPECSHIVSKASTKRSKGLIHDHVLTHANDSQAKLDLVFTEQRFHLPISHLVSHIQELAASRGVDTLSPANSPVTKRVKR